MQIDFEEVKKIRITDVCGRYQIRLKFRGTWASAPCPLPTHNAGDKGRNFTVNVEQNYWRCFSESCNARNGGKKGGDVINFVALMERCGIKQAAEKLVEWYGPEKKKAEHMAPPVGEGSKNNPPLRSPDHNPSAVAGKGYIHAVDAWLEELLKREAGETDDAYLARLKKGIKGKLVESYRNGRRASQGLPPETSAAGLAS